MVPGTMPRLPRVETLLGATLDDVTEVGLQRLVDSKVREADDLDFKKAVYWVPVKDELGKDVAALANHVGGLLIIGIAEDGDAHAEALNAFPVNDVLERTVQEIVADHVHPTPLVKTRRLEAVSADGGYLLIAVPRSALAPHAVQKPGTHQLGYPVRSGTGTRWLAESEVAERYRSRFREAVATIDLVVRRSAAIPPLLDPAVPWLMVTVVPDVPGHVEVAAATGREVAAWLRDLPGTGLDDDALVFDLPGVRYGPGRFVFAHQQDDASIGFHVELYGDGGAVIAADIGDNPDDGLYAIPESRLTSMMVAALGLAATYAVDVAGTVGTASISAEIIEPHRDRPGHLDHSMILKDSRPAGSGGWHTYRRIAGTNAPFVVPAANATIDVGAARSSMTERVAAAHLMLRPLIQGFGLAEPARITSSGALRMHYFPAPPAEWAAANGVNVDDGSL